MLRLIPSIFAVIVIYSFTGCKKESNIQEPKLVFTFKFDSTQTRLNNIGQPASMPSDHAGQSPVFHAMSAHYLELAQHATTQLGEGAILYHANETNAGGEVAIDFEKSKFAGDNEEFFSIPLSQVASGEYEWLRLSLAYQNYEVKLKIDTVINSVPLQQEIPTTVASFVGYNTYIKNFTIQTQSIPVNANRKQGFWGAEAVLNFGGNAYPFSQTGQAPEGATTVVNPLFASSPIPQGSCVVTARILPDKLKITGNETSDITIEISLSVNKSFEWKEVVFDGKWEPSKGEEVVDMGLRGMIPMKK